MAAARIPSKEDVAAASAATGPVTVRAGVMTRLGVAARVARIGVGKPVESRGNGELHTARLVLRPMRIEDRSEFLRVLRISRSSLDAMCPLGSGEETSDDGIFLRQLALSDGAVRTGKACRLVAIDSAGQLVGGFNINDITRGLEHGGELVFWLSADARRLGYAEEGVRGLLDFAFADMPRGLGLHRVHAYVAPDNDACRRLMPKVGMRMSTSAAPVELRIGSRRVRHDAYEAFASVGAIAERGTMGHVVEGKPSIAEELFGRGLLSILRTEHSEPGESGATPPNTGGV